MQTDFQGLMEYFKNFPGIGRRQAERFCYYVLSKDETWVNNFMREFQNTRKNVSECSVCFRIFKNSYNQKENKCAICKNENRNKNILAVFEKNIDLETFLQKTKYDGLIFVLGGNIPVIEKKNKTEKIKLGELLIYIKNLMLTTPTPPYQGGDNAVLNKEIFEVLLCNSATADGFYTANFIADEIKKLYLENIKITTFGRGFSTGTELEYVDKDTLDHAMKHREIL